MTSLTDISDGDLDAVLSVMTIAEMAQAHDTLTARGRGYPCDMHDHLCVRLGTIHDCANSFHLQTMKGGSVA